MSNWRPYLDDVSKKCNLIFLVELLPRIVFRNFQSRKRSPLFNNHNLPQFSLKSLSTSPISPLHYYDRTPRFSCYLSNTWNRSLCCFTNTHTTGQKMCTCWCKQTGHFCVHRPHPSQGLLAQLSCRTSTVHTCTQYTKIVSDKPIHGMARAYLLELGYSEGLVRVSDEYFVVLDTVVWVAWIVHLFEWGAWYYCMGWMDCRNGE